MRKIVLPLTALAVSITLSACSSLQRQDLSTSGTISPAETLLPISQEDLQALAAPSEFSAPGEFTKDSLYTLLSAEIAGQRNQFDIALQNYVAEARRNRDLGVVIRALRISQFLKAEPELLEMAELWSELDPSASEPHHLASIALIRTRDYEGAVAHMEQLLNLEGSTNFDNLALHAKNLSEEDREQLLALYGNLRSRHPDNLEIIFGHAILQELNEQHPEALSSIDQLLQEDPEHQPALLMRARLLHQVKGLGAALAYLKKVSRQHPDNRQLGTIYARLLIDNQELELAQEEFRKLMERFPDTPGLKLSYALVAIENKQTDLARQQLQELLQDRQHTDEAHFYLARLADQEQQVDDALKHYQQVRSGTHFFTALGRSAYLLATTERVPEALNLFERAQNSFPDQSQQIQQLQINLLMELEEYEAAMIAVNDALQEQPEDSQLLYIRASIHDKLNDIDAMERDLRQILDKEPDNAVALNALGYILADRTDRYQEAYGLIEKALALKPDNPAIMDSMGWAEYRLGNLEQALNWLRLAYERFPDPEVASHLGEVLWISGQQDEAMRVWLESLSEHPGNPLITGTMSRLGAQASDANE